MSYYQYEYESPIPLYARIKEELKSYFSTGVVDDLMFPIWTEDCLRELQRGSYKIEETVLTIQDFKTKLPPNFMYVREAWLCTTTNPVEVPLPGATFHSVTQRIDFDIPDGCQSSCDPCTPPRVDVYYKTISNAIYTTSITSLMRPGKTTMKNYCAEDSPNLRASSIESFEIKDKNLFTNFTVGEIYLTYYAKQFDEEGNLLIPENKKIRNYIENYIKFKLFEQIWNSVTDETANQIERKVQFYDIRQQEAFTNAQVETRLRTPQQRVDSMKRVANSLNRFKL